jgi:hypothetical protein
MRNRILVVLLLCFSFVYSQQKKAGVGEGMASRKTIPPVKKAKAAYDQYRIISLQRDTTYVDTSLTIKKEYAYNYLRKDIFGLLPFANEGHTYAVLDYGLTAYRPFPEIGFSGLSTIR